MILLSCFDTINAFPMVNRRSSLALPQATWLHSKGIKETPRTAANGGWSWINGSWEKRQERRKTAMSPKQQSQGARKYLVWTELNIWGLINRLERRSRPQGMSLSAPRESGTRGRGSDEGRKQQEQPSLKEGQQRWGPRKKRQLGHLFTTEVRLRSCQSPTDKGPGS